MNEKNNESNFYFGKKNLVSGFGNENSSHGKDEISDELLDSIEKERIDDFHKTAKTNDND